MRSSTASSAVLSLLVAVLLWCENPAASGQQREMTPAEQKAADMRLPELDRSALEPDMRLPTKVEESERNPFGVVSAPTAAIEPLAAETEEMRLRRILGSMRVTGLSGEPGSYRALLGTMQLREGERLPKMFADQAEVLRVTSITDREIKLSFEEKDPSLPPRTIGIGYDLRPRPASLLPGELYRRLVPFTPKGAVDMKPLTVPPVSAILEGAEAVGLQGQTERSFELMGDPTFRDGNEETIPQDD